MSHSDSIINIEGEKFGSSRSVSEDNEGNIWIGTTAEGLIRFTQSAFKVYEVLSNNNNKSMKGITSDLQVGSIWISGNCNGLFQYKNGKLINHYSSRNSPIFDECIWGLAFFKNGTL